MTAPEIPTSYADSWPGPWFYFGALVGAPRTITVRGAVVGYYLPGDNRCFAPWAQGAMTTRYICGPWHPTWQIYIAGGLS